VRLLKEDGIMSALPKRLVGQPSQSLIINPGGKGALITELNKAQHSIDLVIYELYDKDIQEVLATQQKARLSVRVILNDFIDEAKKYGDKNQVAENYEKEAITFLKSMGIQYKTSSLAFSNTHQKTFIIDAADLSTTYSTTEAIIMSFNLVENQSENYFTNTRDFAIITTDFQQISDVEAVFNEDWNYNCHNNTNITPALSSSSPLVISPANSRSVLAQLINIAETSIEMYMEELVDHSIVSILAAKASAVKVRVLVAKEINSNINTMNIINATNNGKMILVDSAKPPKLYLHAKMVLVDGKQVYVGSENASETSLNKNREMGIITQDSQIISQLQSTFNSDWTIYSEQS
jgi:cardiolipin synthase